MYLTIRNLNANYLTVFQKDYDVQAFCNMDKSKNHWVNTSLLQSSEKCKIRHVEKIKDMVLATGMVNWQKAGLEIDVLK